MYKKIFVPLMLINNNVYTFVSGIFISLSINIFTSLCFEKSKLYNSWFMYLASLVFLVASALCMYLATKLSKFQNYIIEKRVMDYEKKKSIVLDATKKVHTKWVVTYICTVLMVIVGILLLVFNFVAEK
ncbi:MAG: hypothetical protein E7284_00075 [Lachnospiraceae bacterium]|nr:hypothetical protein [Lachnospiraceae bacterium]